jgi:hypothetical protein
MSNNLRLSVEYIENELKHSERLVPTEVEVTLEYLDEMIDFRSKNPYGDRYSRFDRADLKKAPVLGKFKNSPLKKKRLK